MKKLIKLISTKGEKFLINPDWIICVTPSAGGHSRITLDFSEVRRFFKKDNIEDYGLTCLETISEIENLVNEETTP